MTDIFGPTFPNTQLLADAFALSGYLVLIPDVFCETDDIFPAEKRRETEDILKQLSVPYELCLYSHVEHGFGVKGDLSHARAKFAKEQAFRQAVCWMDEYVKKDWREEDGRS
ncbi:hypothetical protein PtrSN002B_008662 [Pyrenophora tritici-repentis]|uniref:Dienelactone hydrolase family protein n=1 Tax=Pyrenophora tritici-repentis (strain Pt-1C-BFP) TaxID=426418 RepID=B2WNI4_PYRTR|nr:dienelactone hydrolase family protein [Pyrenophora tritici-repentis Pt-1C-BFP]KAG9389241.1 hypothetical protein A1F94_002134 [Pyrenophora tritici-repentis]EDU44594.1 dienelactone hydrolase family protein [Pyrenophora tritici-repentis Pt-1C-BFP]KAI0606842.1 hypothetical protein TUN205_08918 [Pyrenophora tritici-repentis]KAI1530616.1 hypothetical protein PtrSN001C_008607 [Pyrenophora tritici-repentis]KAI1540476.1 hypothetical protein PtrSN002B_008662 [Pyrenophora tritici-repentis]